MLGAYSQVTRVGISFTFFFSVVKFMQKPDNGGTCFNSSIQEAKTVGSL